METKRCPKCATVKPVEEFFKYSKAKDGLARRCKVCSKAAQEDWKKRNEDYHKEHYQVNKDEKLKANKEWRDNNKERSAKVNKEWYVKNVDHVLAKSQKWREENPEREVERNHEWYEKNKEEVLRKIAEYKKKNKEYLWEKELEYRRKRMKTDPIYRVTDRLRSRLRCALKANGTSKTLHTIDLLGCSPKELVEHLEKQFQDGMTWENHGKDGWEIDHIKPCASFNLIDEEEQRLCFHYTNLQPLWAKENQMKRDKLDWTRDDDKTEI